MNRVKELLLKAEKFISQQELKELATLIITEEAEKYGEEIPVIETPTIIKYYKQNIHKGKKYSLKYKIETIINYFKKQGEFNPVEEKIIFFYNNLETIFLNQKIEKKSFSLQLLYLIFHEYKHMIQENNSNQMFQIETQLLNLDYEFYMNNHSKFLCEIEAKLYGILKAEEKLKEYGLLTKKHQKHIEHLKQKYCQLYADYDANIIINQLDKNIVSEKRNIYIQDDSLLIYIYKRSKKPRTLQEILENENFYNTDKTFQNIYVLNRLMKIKDPNEFENFEKWQLEYILGCLNNELTLMVIQREYYINIVSSEIDFTKYNNRLFKLVNLRTTLENKLEKKTRQNKQ